ncbi:hypothetical protein [Kushneria phosphatilytica]|uniref:Uncharacterized protein n=1 Tax=Kushneria phosphatilytica TaxID=657387 RepID=A0A1S1NYF4_9GAMM|nr:hypothetical protein [Kushneria phosphatilytica]OHV11883.1 hypothetical protein BH688_04125 [Kushneria phosphatilytica]QEL11056.1 hypothetical protein FY550_07880 [Kushneria phosphatilytica]
MSGMSLKCGLILAAGSMIALSGCAGSSTQTEQNNEPTAAITAPQHQQYRNTSEGYTLTYPQQWQNDVIERDSAEWMGQTLSAENVAMFYYKDYASDGTPQPLVALAVYTQAQWDQLKSQSQPLPPIMARKDDRILAAYIASANPYDPTSSNGQAFARKVPTPDQLSSAISW